MSTPEYELLLRLSKPNTVVNGWTRKYEEYSSRMTPRTNIFVNSLPHH